MMRYGLVGLRLYSGLGAGEGSLRSATRRPSPGAWSRPRSGWQSTPIRVARRTASTLGCTGRLKKKFYLPSASARISTPARCFRHIWPTLDWAPWRIPVWASLAAPTFRSPIDGAGMPPNVCQNGRTEEIFIARKPRSGLRGRKISGQALVGFLAFAPLRFSAMAGESLWPGCCWTAGGPFHPTSLLGCSAELVVDWLAIRRCLGALDGGGAVAPPFAGWQGWLILAAICAAAPPRDRPRPPLAALLRRARRRGAGTIS